MSFIYSITLYPLELLYKYAYLLCLQISHNYVAALLCLSVLSTLIFHPLKAMAAKSQARERHIQEIMDPQLKRIKDESTGAERHRRITGLYKRYAYHPIMALRSTFGVMLQVPFLFGAYTMLSTFEPIKGQSFWHITDLSQPDALLGGINLLPVLMTAFNLAAVFITLNFTRKDRIQAIIIALLFLLLLYTAPAALLIYWTSNNFFMLLENVYAFVKRPASRPKALEATAPRAPWFMKVSQKLTAKGYVSLYFSALLALAMLLCLFAPAAIYVSDQTYFGNTLLTTLGQLLPYAITMLLAGLVLWLITPHGLRPWLTVAMSFACLAALLNALVFTGNYGDLDGVVLHAPEQLHNPMGLLRDAAVLLICLALLGLAYAMSLVKKLATLLQLVVAGFIVFAVVSNFSEDSTATAELSAVEQVNVFAFSKEKPNVLIVVMDMFTGGHMEDMLRDQPDLYQKLAGFVWYPDTLATSKSTFLSCASIYGGPGYRPAMMNQRPGMSLKAKLLESTAVLPRNFGNQGFVTSYIQRGLSGNMPWNLQTISSYNPGPAERLLFYNFPFTKTLAQWKERLGISHKELALTNLTNYLLTVAIFRGAPHCLKGAIYEDGNWLGTAKLMTNERVLDKVLYQTAMLGLLPELANTESPNGTLKVLWTNLTHYPWHLQEHSLEPVNDPYPATEGQLTLVNGIVPEHYYTEKHAINLLANLFAWMRANQVYDNTKIILVSDHGYSEDSRMLMEALGGEDKMPIKGIHALLMVKDLHAQGPLTISSDFMAIEDVPALACAVIGGCDVITPPVINKQRPRHTAQGNVPGDDQPENTFDFTGFAVKGSIFKLDSWQREKP